MNAKDLMIKTVVEEDMQSNPHAACPDCAEMGLNEEDVSPTFYDGTHDHCPDCGDVFEYETYPYCKHCRVRWD